MTHLRLNLLCLSVSMALTPAYGADLTLSPENQPTNMQSIASNGQLNKTANGATTGEKVYIVEFTDPPVATYDGGIQGYKATSNKATGAKKLNTNSKESKAYRKYLKKNQEKFVADLGAQSNVKFDYQYVFNGVAIAMSAAEAKALESQPEVKRVYLEHIETPDTDAGPSWINADSIWSGPPNNVPHSQGAGIVVAILDTGINHASSSFADVGGDGYDHSNPLGTGNYVTGSYCDTQDPSFCNDKLIGAWTFVPLDSQYPVPEDSDGHGSHTASTVAGNINPTASVQAPTTSLTRSVSGVAPHANIIAYDVCTEGCPGSALLAAINQVVVDAASLPDGIHALNYSISGGTNPYTDAVEIGFLNATAAGVYVAASAGNSGPGASTMGHQSPWVSTTGASTHNRNLANSLQGMQSDQASLADITSVGFTSGYGPAAIVYAGDFPTANGSQNDADPAQCLDPFPAGHFSGEIVVCDRGTIARTAKGQNVLAGGAGGLVLANLAANGESVTGDAHFLPAVHLGVTDGNTLKSWIAANSNTVAAISGFEVVVEDSLGDVMAGFSSRGPNSALDIIKPDLTAPGVDILAALSAVNAPQADVYGFLSGTSMSSPHNAGAGAIVSAARPGWSPYAVRSAMMMSSSTANVRKEDGVSPADPFDMGAGRIDLARAIEVDLILDETPFNFWNANPDTGGDPKTLNIASMQDGTCVGSCQWTRTFTNTAKHTVHVDLSASSTGDADFVVTPASLKLKAGKTASFTVQADTSTANGWNFGQLDIARKGDGPDLHMPIAANAVTSTDAAVFSKTVSQATADNGDILTYSIDITNGQLGGNIDLTDSIPAGIAPIAGSETANVVGGTTISPFAIAGNNVSWTGTLDVGSIAVSESPSPFGLFPLAGLGIAPRGCPSDCDDGAFSFTVPGFTYNGQMYSQVIMSVNGTLEVGTASGNAASAGIQKMPSITPPNNLLAALWTDLNMTDEGDMYVAVLNAGPNQYTVYEWNSIPLFGNNAEQYTFQIWVKNGNAGGIWYVYGALGDLSYASVGAENEDGSIGASYYFSGDGSGTAPGADLKVTAVQGGSASFTFQAQVTGCSNANVIVNEANITADENAHERAIAVTTCN